MSANNSDSIGDSVNDFDGPLHVNDAIDTAVGRRVSDAFAAYADGIHEVAPCADDDADDGAALLLQTERGQAALDRLACVHPKQHAAVIACVIEGLSVRTAAKTRFGVSHKAVHMRKHLGLEKLRVWCHDEAKPQGDVA